LTWATFRLGVAAVAETSHHHSFAEKLASGKRFHNCVFSHLQMTELRPPPLMDFNSVNEEERKSKIVRLRGLPWNVCVEDIMQFLQGVNVLNGEKGIHLITSFKDGRPNGECFVECATEDDVDSAFGLHKQMLGHRYIEGKYRVL
jgi:hypothetical protein